MSESSNVALITGGSRGIGRAIAKILAENNFKVAINFRSNKEEADRVRNEIEADGGTAEIFQGNVACSDDMDRIVAEIEIKFGPVDVLVNSAGILKDNFFMMMSEEEFDDVISTNLKGTFLATRAVIRNMTRNRRGRIINVVSISGLIGTPGQANYASSKGGVISMTRSLAREVSKYGILVNAVAPGFIDTEMLKSLNPKSLDTAIGQIPLKRLGQPSEVAELVNFLASEKNTYITGQTMVIDGGISV